MNKFVVPLIDKTKITKIVSVSLWCSSVSGTLRLHLQHDQPPLPFPAQSASASDLVASVSASIHLRLSRSVAFIGISLAFACPGGGGGGEPLEELLEGLVTEELVPPLR
ncbi:hypothetical protein BT93_H1323 [Corymbia citriodora subsp. variegata]|nr:hypothetical protein BT93_H1323 [Corymbia citriodora subsp. variegata]